MPNPKNAKIAHFSNKPIIILCLVGLASLLVRLYYFPYGVPLTLDALMYFFYGTDMSILKSFPTGYHFPNNGWPALLSIFFSVLPSDKFLDHMTLQRLVSVSISVLTIIPLYYLCKKFFNKTHSIVGVILFAFEPHIIQNSLLGITEPLYIFLVTASLCTLLSEKRLAVYATFATAALCSIVRYEGLVLFAVLTVVFFIRHRHERKAIVKYAIAVGVFSLIILPMMYVRTQTIGSEGLVNHVVAGGNVAVNLSTKEANGPIAFIGNGFLNFFKYLGWVMLPFLIFLAPVGLIPVIAKKRITTATLLISLAILSIPAFYAYSRHIQETRYLLVLIPLLSVLSMYSIKQLEDKIKRQRLILIIIIALVLISSLIFLEIRKYDYERQRESFMLGKEIYHIAKGINNYDPEDTYLVPAQLPNDWPALRSSIQSHVLVVPIDGFDSLEEYIEFGKNNGLTHLVIDDSTKRPDFLRDVLHNSQKYPYLKQVFDSDSVGFRYHAKIYEIDYDKFYLK